MSLTPEIITATKKVAPPPNASQLKNAQGTRLDAGLTKSFTGPLDGFELLRPMGVPADDQKSQDFPQDFF
ncbi:MAG: hypothetical protein AAGI45_05335 [Cyanobacteria bacterium P01_H01_bin.26]